jgi:hypothetical protein
VKRDPLVLDRVSFLAVPPAHSNGPPVRAFTPNGDCRHDRIRIHFRMTQSDHADVQIIKPGGRLILTLGRDEFLKRYTEFTYYWDGRTRGDGIAAPGRYKLRVKMLGQGRTLVPGLTMRLHKAPSRPSKGCPSGGGGQG